MLKQRSRPVVEALTLLTIIALSGCESSRSLPSLAEASPTLPVRSTAPNSGNIPTASPPQNVAATASESAAARRGQQPRTARTTLQLSGLRSSVGAALVLPEQYVFAGARLNPDSTAGPAATIWEVSRTDLTQRAVQLPPPLDEQSPGTSRSGETTSAGGLVASGGQLLAYSGNGSSALWLRNGDGTWSSLPIGSKTIFAATASDSLGWVALGSDSAGRPTTFLIDADGGVKSYLSAGLSDKVPRDLIRLPSGRLVAAGGEPGYTVRSDDLGATWAVENRLARAHVSTFLVNQNGGESLCGIASMDAEDVTSGVIVSSDGATWSTAAHQSVWPTGALRTVASTAASVMVFGVDDDSAAIWESSDCANWTRTPGAPGAALPIGAADAQVAVMATDTADFTTTVQVFSR